MRGQFTEFKITGRAVGIASRIDLGHTTFYGEGFGVEFDGVFPLLYFEVFIACIPETISVTESRRPSSGSTLSSEVLGHLFGIPVSAYFIVFVRDMYRVNHTSSGSPS